MTGTGQDAETGATTGRFVGEWPTDPALDGVLDEAPELLGSLADEFAPTADTLSTPQAYWIALNGWITDRLSGPILEGATSADELSRQAWTVFVSAYWGGMELRTNWGMPPAMERLGIQLAPPFAEPLQGLGAQLAARFTALQGSDDDCLRYVEELLHDGTGTGAIWNTAYNAGCQVVKTEDPPIGQRRPHRRPRPGVVRINPRDFMRVDYEMPTPEYLKVWRSAFERAVTASPERYEAVIAGEAGQEGLREIWARGVTFGNTSWGDGANDGWTDEYFDESLHWSTVVNLGLEAISHASFVAVIDRDADAARRAIMGNTIYVGMGTGWLLGFLDLDGRFPELTPA
ncbi:MAG: hypothetical protein AB7H43_06755 [Acidimicrobiia bacterium]